MLFGRFQHVNDAVEGLLNILHERNRGTRLVRVEGSDGVGKSTLSKALSHGLRATYLETDEPRFRFQPERWTTFIETVHVDVYQEEARKALDAGGWVVADSVCLDDVLPEHLFGRGFRIYVMPIETYYGGFSRWSYGADLQREPIRYNDLDLSIRNYHLTFKPHWRADAIVQIVDER
jgi:hypothetical protein